MPHLKETFIKRLSISCSLAESPQAFSLLSQGDYYGLPLPPDQMWRSFLGLRVGGQKHSWKEHTLMSPDLWAERLERGGKSTECSPAWGMGFGEWWMPQGSLSRSLNSSQEEHDSSFPPFFFTAGLSCFHSSGYDTASSQHCLKAASQSHFIPLSWLSLNVKTSTSHVPSNLF